MNHPTRTSILRHLRRAVTPAATPAASSIPPPPPIEITVLPASMAWAAAEIEAVTFETGDGDPLGPAADWEIRAALTLPGHFGLIAHSAGRPVGYLIGAMTPFGPTELMRLVVKPSSQRQGVGRALLATFCQYERNRGHQAVVPEECVDVQCLLRKDGWRAEAMERGGKVIRFSKNNSGS